MPQNHLLTYVRLIYKIKTASPELSMLQSKQTSRDDRRSKVSVNIDDIGSNKIKKRHHCHDNT